MDRKQLHGQDIYKFATAGNATVTIVNPTTGNRFTYKLRQKTNDDGSVTPHFVSVLNGSDNESDYTYIGFIRDGVTFIYGGAKARAGRDAPSVRAFEWFWRHVGDPTPAEVWHEGRCGKCGRKLTVPESIERGLGPTCAQVAA